MRIRILPFTLMRIRILTFNFMWILLISLVSRFGPSNAPKWPSKASRFQLPTFRIQLPKKYADPCGFGSATLGMFINSLKQLSIIYVQNRPKNIFWQLLDDRTAAETNFGFVPNFDCYTDLQRNVNTLHHDRQGFWKKCSSAQDHFLW